MRLLFYLIVVLYICTSCFHDFCETLEETKPGSKGKNKTRTSQKKFKVAKQQKQQKLKQEFETGSLSELLKQKLLQNTLTESHEQLISQRQEQQLQLTTTTLRRRHKKNKLNQKLLKHAQTDTQQQQQRLHTNTNEHQHQDRVQQLQQLQEFQPKLPSTIQQQQINFPSIEEPTAATTTTTSTTTTKPTTSTTTATSITATATTTTQPLQETPLKECNIQRGKAKYHVTVVRGECCKPRKTGRNYMEQRADDHENSLLYNWNKEQLNNSNNPNYDHKSVDSIFKQLLTGDPNNNNNNHDMDLDTYFNNNKINNYINNRPQQQSHDHPLVDPPSSSSSSSSSIPEFDTSDFETVFLLDRLSKLETQLTNTKKIFQSKMFSLEQKLAASASRISFAVDQRNEQQKQQLQGIHEAMRQQHKEQLDVQEKQQSQLIRMREEFSVENTPCNRAMKTASSGLYGLDGLENHDNNINSNNDNNINSNNDNNIDSNNNNNHDVIDFTGGDGGWRNQTLHYQRIEQPRRMDSTDYNLPLKDEPGRNENGLLNSLYASFTVLRQELAEAKKEVEEMEKRLQAEKQEKEDIRYELNGRIEQLWSLTDELRETSQKNLQLQETVTQLTTAKEQLEKELETEKEIRDQTVGQLTECLRQFHDVNEKYQNQSILVGIIRSRLDDCITGQLPLHCEFEDERVCGFEQDSYSDHLDWIRTRGLEPSNSSKTKPPKDNTCQNARGYYMTVLVTTRMLGQVARMKTPRLFGFNEQCVEFYYWISGRYVGTLNVYTEVPDEGLLNPVWRIYGHQGDIWIKSRLNIPANVVRSGYRMVFEGIVDRGLNGDIAIDDFKVEEGHCDAPLVKTTPNPEDGSPKYKKNKIVQRMLESFSNVH